MPAFYKQLLHKLKLLIADWREFCGIFIFYTQRKLYLYGRWFEKYKKLIVDGLIAKRGRFTRPFLHFGVGTFFMLGMILGPVLATSYPILAQKSELANAQSPSAILTSAIAAELPLSTEISPKPRSKIDTYIVQQGDTISSIALDKGISEDTILWANDLKSTDTLTVGQELQILPVSGVAHKVLKGDSIYSIAKKYQTEAQKIADFPFNNFEDPEAFSLIPGQTLIVPDGKPPEATPAPTTVPRYIAQDNSLPSGTVSTQGYIWPTVGQISQYPIWYHMAFDIANNALPAIVVARTGIVSFADCVKTGYGCHVIVDHGDGMQTLYAHMSAFSVSTGQKVSQGQILGRMGSTGRSTGPHLHFEIRKNGTLLNPSNFLK